MLNRIKNLTNLLGSTLKPRTGGGEFLLRETDFGTVHVETEAVRRVVERVKVDGVHEIKNVVVDKPVIHEPLRIKLNLIIGQNYAAPKVGADLREAVKAELNELFGIKSADFDIRVTQINRNLPEKLRRRVR